MMLIAASALLAAATSVVAAPGLSLKLSGPAQAKHVDEFAVVATIRNTGDETLKLFNDPRGTLSTFAANTFAITSDSGTSPHFIGAKGKYGFMAAVESGDAKAFTVLAPGESVDVTHDLSTAYNFTSTGSYSVQPTTLFHYLDTSGEVKQIYAQTEKAAHRTSLSGNLISSKVQARSRHYKRASFVGCTAAQQAQIAAAIPVAINYMTEAYKYLGSYSSATPRYTRWFGAFAAANRLLVQTHFAKILTNIPSPTDYTYECGGTMCAPGDYAYVLTNQFGYVHFCSAFWTASAVGFNSQAGTIVHESTHFIQNGGTEDHAYGINNPGRDALALAISNPELAVMNADSHEYFAENSPALP